MILRSPRQGIVRGCVEPGMNVAIDVNNWREPQGNASISIPEHILSQEVGEDVVLLNLRSGEYYGLNALGSRIWSHLRQDKPIGELVGTLIEEYEVTKEQLWNDIRQFLLTLQNRELITLYEKSPQ